MTMDRCQFAILRTPQEFELIRDDWNRLAESNPRTDFYLSYDWFYSLLFLSQMPPDRLRIMTARRDNEVIAILPCCSSQRRGRMLTLDCLEFLGNIYSPLRGGLVKQGEEATVAGDWLQFLKEQYSREWDILNLEGLSPGDPFVRALMETAESSHQFPVVEQFANIVSDLSGFENGESYFRALGKSLRQTIRTGLNRMNREGRADILMVGAGPGNIEQAMAHYRAVYEGSWKKTEKADPQFHSKLADYLGSKGSLRLFLLYYQPSRDSARPSVESYDSCIGTADSMPDSCVPIASCFFIVHRRRAYSVKTAYRQEYSSFDPGTVLFWFATKYLLERDHIAVVDHQKGSESYKLKLVGHVNETRIQLRIVNSSSVRAKVELWAETHLVPSLRTLKRALRSSREASEDQQGREARER
jgi:CelD/BcsL family acetyltransferase involved in cellulose biosynthesis